MSYTKNKKYLFTGIILMAFIFSVFVGYTDSKSWITEKRQQDEQKTMNQMPTFTQEHNNEEFFLPMGEPFRLILPENPTSGYIWMVAEPISSNIILLRQEYLPGNFGFPMMGAGGLRNMIFKTIEKGRSELVLHLRRPWEPEDEYVDVFTLRFEIK